MAAGGQPGGSYEDAKISQRRLQPKEMAILEQIAQTNWRGNCVCVSVQCDSVLVSVCVIVGVYLFASVCVSV